MTTPQKARKRLDGAELLRNAPLRVLLIVIMVAVSALGLVASSVAVTTLMRNVIYDRVDEDLASALQGWARNEDIFDATAGHRPPSEYTVMVYDSRGGRFFNVDSTAVPNVKGLSLDGTPRTIGTVTANTDTTHIQPHDDTKWRAVATDTGNTVIVVAKNIERERALIKGLAAIQGLISAMVLVLIGLAAFWAIRRALRPLEVVEKTATKIAAGDLGRRLPEWPEHTEVGQLSRALNIMLARLESSIDTAREKEEQMRRFVGDASHELRTPLTSLRGYTELYRSGATQDVDLVLGKVDDESKRMSLLVEDLLALTRAEGTRLEVRPVDVLELALAAGSSARAAFPGRVIKVRNTCVDVPMALADADRLHQVLINLVSNGLRHGGADAEVEIRVSSFPDKVCLEIADNGKGMPEDVVAHIFERFYRADSSRTRDTGGSGLGLAITKSLVEQQDGSISVRSVEGEGTTFCVCLPTAP